jgi:hypothetical protein
MKVAGIDISTPAVRVLYILCVGEISKFRSVRNLNENAQIEQYKLDKIMEDLDADVLYDAIHDRIDKLKAKNAAQKIFNLTCGFFTLNQDTYSRVYEVGVIKCPHYSIGK